MVRRGSRWIVAVVLGLTLATPQGGWGQAMPQASQNYVLGPGDVIEVFIRGHDDLSRTVTVRPDGSITLPLLGPLVVAGLTLPQLRNQLRQLYGKYLKSPEVAVVLAQFRKIRIAILGEVVNPGLRELPAGSTILDAISSAGGLSANAGAAQSYLLRDGRELIPLDIPQLLSGNPRANVVLQDGDVVVVPDAGRVFVLGEVGRPGPYRLSQDPTLLDVLLQAGGVTERASLPEARLLRRGRDPVLINLEALLVKADVSQNVTLQPGDVIVIPEDPRRDRRVYVLGEVGSPGAFSLRDARTVLRAVTLAGGVTARGSASNAYLIRRPGSAQNREGQIIKVDLDALVRRGEFSRDMPLQEGDIIYVPASTLSRVSTFLQAILSVLSGVLGLGAVFR